ncbi:MAG: hypothetical protein MI919_06740, partial [Holophagales bacterium]|nr:hypothetical protein [Holophagales bacterium]
MGDVFVGTLCVIGFFLFSYKGYERADDLAGDLGCFFAVGVALFPTDEDPDLTTLPGMAHLGFATLLFLVLIYFSLFLFTKTNPNKPPTSKKLQRNRIYRICGCTMAACILLIGLLLLLPRSATAQLEPLRPIFWLEAICIFVFGISWLTKGEAILADQD